MMHAERTSRFNDSLRLEATRTGRISKASIRSAPRSFIARAMTRAMSVTMKVWWKRTRIPSEEAISWSKKRALIVRKLMNI